MDPRPDGDPFFCERGCGGGDLVLEEMGAVRLRRFHSCGAGGRPALSWDLVGLLYGLTVGDHGLGFAHQMGLFHRLTR